MSVCVSVCAFKGVLKSASGVTVHRLSVLISAKGGRCLNQAVTW